MSNERTKIIFIYIKLCKFELNCWRKRRRRRKQIDFLMFYWPRERRVFVSVFSANPTKWKICRFVAGTAAAVAAQANHGWFIDTTHFNEKYLQKFRLAAFYWCMCVRARRDYTKNAHIVINLYCFIWLKRTHVPWLPVWQFTHTHMARFRLSNILNAYSRCFTCTQSARCVFFCSFSNDEDIISFIITPCTAAVRWKTIKTLDFFSLSFLLHV